MEYPVPPALQEYIDGNFPKLLQLIRDLCGIPSPSLQERNKAEFCKQWLENEGAQGVYIDEANNCIYPVTIKNSRDIPVFIAHTDTVFPDLEPLPFTEQNGKFFCPGVGDDTANLAILMMIASYIAKEKIHIHPGMIIAANAGEEALGNLYGCRQIMKSYEGRVRELISFDSTSFDHVYTESVGSHRYKVTFRTEGGHSFSDFGNANAVVYMASMIQTLYQIKVPEKGITTYNVGLIRGGTSINSIAQDAEMFYEYRSTSLESLECMNQFFYAVIDAYRKIGIIIDVDLVGERKCSSIGSNGDAQEKLIKKAKTILKDFTGQVPEELPASTDCNVPLSMGIPAVGLGLCIGGGAHTREEWIDIESLKTGLKIAASFISSYWD